MKIDNKFILMSVFILLIGFTSSLESLGIYKQGECLDVRQTCVSCTYVNISVTNPNSTIVLNNIGMDSQGAGVWIKEFCETSTTGRYDVVGAGDLDGTDTGFAYFFKISATGTELTQAKAVSYTIILIISIFIFLGLLFVGIKLPSKNKSDELTGYIIAVSNLKYLKTIMLGLSYLSMVWISYFTWMIVYAFLDFTFLSSLFKIMFYTLAISTFPLFVLYVYFTIANFIRDKDIKDLLLRGLTTR